MFFEPLPPPQPLPHEQTWGPPLWDRPSEGTVPTVLAVNQIVHRSDNGVVVIDALDAYPNGFTVRLGIRLNPHRARENQDFMRRGPGLLRFPRVGVRFSDGREGGRGVPWRRDLPKDEQGLPLEPFVGMGGGGGGSSQGWHFAVWVYPLPPEGPLQIFVGLPAVDPSDQDVETSITIEGGDVRTAAARATVIWT